MLTGTVPGTNAAYSSQHPYLEIGGEPGISRFALVRLSPTYDTDLVSAL